MNWWQRLWRRQQMEEYLNNEVQFHIEQHAADLMARGIDPENARRQARLAIGGPEQVKESCRDARGTRHHCCMPGQRRMWRPRVLARTPTSCRVRFRSPLRLRPGRGRRHFLEGLHFRPEDKLAGFEHAVESRPKLFPENVILALDIEQRDSHRSPILTLSRLKVGECQHDRGGFEASAPENRVVSWKNSAVPWWFSQEFRCFAL